MCGICGALVFDGGHFEITENYISRMRDTMEHRGPDGAGAWVSPDRRVGLGHRRLSIIDLSQAAGQPMCNEDGSVWVCFNGEIYNHAEIRAELERTGGHSWKTDHSDTEMIIHAFEQWGIECIERFRGMFGLAIWDGRSRELWLIRDRIGIKPVYFSTHHGRITFASEIKALLTDPDQKREVNEEALYHYLSFITTPAPSTLFEGISKLPPASILRVRSDGSTEMSRYWDMLERATPLKGVPEDEIASRILAELRTSVKLRKESDVPVGVFLSGGIDSSTNAALFSEGETSTVKTFTIGYEGEYDSYKNELNYAQMMADVVKSEHYELKLTIDDLLDFLPRMIHLQDEPIGDPVCVPVFYVSKLARDNGVIVCQVGEGADELFIGYPWWQDKLNFQRANDLPIPGFIRKAALPVLRRRGFGDTQKYEWLRRVASGQPVFWGGADIFGDDQKMRLLSPRLAKKFKTLTSWEALRPIYQRYTDNAWEKTHINWMSYLDLNFRIPELLLMRVDKMSMGVSLEGRVPFLDHKFVELGMSVPAAVKYKNDELKYILKKAVRGVIPDELIDRKKQGFGVPVHEWFMDRLGDKIRVEIDGFLRETDFLNPEEVRRMYDAGAGWSLWFLLNFVLWWKHAFK